ncbi:MAG: hypothetical protein ACFCVG_09110 [Kineosporiaceae bacterium]
MSATWAGTDDARVSGRSLLLFPLSRRRHQVANEDLATTLASLARLAQDLADQVGLLDVMVAEVGDAPAEEARAATLRATAELHAAAGALHAVAGQVRP